MYEYCKSSITKKAGRNALTEEVCTDFKKKLGVFLWQDEVTEEQYNELVELLVVSVPATK